ncbi:hypothetical protein [Cupriavidus numazuensis]|uniref:Uncharacterized protein n=1 Tax=Cupriavidus numazuensis TaxID=221992 RepID=A0ABM8TB94_9BURK|nr:hypothetical protein [Cupriavidus numazuensis]CAG2132286.1 hypothetical protein LMG26411_00589 [Cupriavidus numazuensis]
MDVDFSHLTDADLDRLRREPKKVENPSARWATKGGHREKNYQVRAIDDETAKYRVFVRVSVSNPAVFSVGLVRLFHSGGALVLVRYNGAYHPHRNVIERNKLPAATHRHIATERYIRAGYDPDGFAELFEGYTTVDGALHCLVRDTLISGLSTSPDAPQQLELTLLRGT